MEPRHVELVWERYAQRLLAFIRSKVSSGEETEDILQEVFVRVHTGICCLQEWTAMDRLVYRITSFGR
jgi:RNA polymerase sigma-70 factor, ECF subfamily